MAIFCYISVVKNMLVDKNMSEIWNEKYRAILSGIHVLLYVIHMEALILFVTFVWQSVKVNFFVIEDGIYICFIHISSVVEISFRHM